MGKGGQAKGGKGWGKEVFQAMFKGGFKGKGKGKGKRRNNPEVTAWIGGLPADEASTERNKELVEHMKQAGNCKFCSIGKGGSGSAVFDSAEEVQNAIAMLNGSDFQGHIIEVDVWTKAEA